MAQKTKKTKSDKLIRIEKAISFLKVLPEQFQLWHNEGKFEIKFNNRGVPCITEIDLRELAYSDFVKKSSTEYVLKYIEQRQKDESTRRNYRFNTAIMEAVKRYKGYVKILEELHTNYQNRINVIHDESALVGAYMLYVKIISLLNMACINLENYHWHSALLLRPIDEAIQLAEYFLITEDTDEGRKNLMAWFRENKTPTQAVCREALSKFQGSFGGEGVIAIHQETLSDLYDSKSKFVHPTYNEILKVLFNPQIIDGEIISNAFDYGPCSNLMELYELTDFFQSSIWSAFQGFFICFHQKMPLSDSDKDILLALNKQFGNEA